MDFLSEVYQACKRNFFKKLEKDSKTFDWYKRAYLESDDIIEVYIKRYGDDVCLRFTIKDDDKYFYSLDKTSIFNIKNIKKKFYPFIKSLKTQTINIYTTSDYKKDEDIMYMINGILKNVLTPTIHVEVYTDRKFKLFN